MGAVGEDPAGTVEMHPGLDMGMDGTYMGQDGLSRSAGGKRDGAGIIRNLVNIHLKKK